MLLLFGVTLGRTVCGWLCPMGLLQELLHRVPTAKLRKSRATRALSGAKYLILAVLVLGIPLWAGVRSGLALPAFCKYLCPAGSLEGAAALLARPGNAGLFAVLGRLFTWKFLVLVAVGLGCVFCYRLFCRFLCPLGAIYSLFNRFALVRVRVDPDRCDGCGACVRSCGMDVRRVGDRECISCGECAAVCPHRAISLRCGDRVPVRPRREDGVSETPARTAVRLGALAVLAAALVYFNFLAG
jgi:polyferredoxin